MKLAYGGGQGARHDSVLTGTTVFLEESNFCITNGPT